MGKGRYSGFSKQSQGCYSHEGVDKRNMLNVYELLPEDLRGRHVTDKLGDHVDDMPSNARSEAGYVVVYSDNRDKKEAKGVFVVSKHDKKKNALQEASSVMDNNESSLPEPIQ